MKTSDQPDIKRNGAKEKVNMHNIRRWGSWTAKGKGETAQNLAHFSTKDSRHDGKPLAAQSFLVFSSYLNVFA